MTDTDQARDLVLGRIRAALSASEKDTARRSAVQAHLGMHLRGTIPLRAMVSGEACVKLFTEMLSEQGADVVRVSTPENIVRAVADYLESNELFLSLRMSEEPILEALPWSLAPAVARSSGVAEASDSASLARALVGAAETGTLFLVSGLGNPTTLNFLPETHMVLINGGDIVGSYEEAWDRLRGLYGQGTLPRTVNLISGPSRTADIEQTIVRGAHGPRRLFVIIFG